MPILNPEKPWTLKSTTEQGYPCCHVIDADGVCVFLGLAADPKERARARLIAAAPETLDLLQEAIDELGSDSPIFDRWEILARKISGTEG